MRQNYNKKNKGLALLGQGKWKSALGHTLLLIGMVLVSMGAFAQTPTGGLYLNKTWIPDPSDPTGGTGEIMLETFVTGDKIIIEKDIPSDIVLVLDVSSSMRQTRGTLNQPTNRALTYNMVAGARTAETNYIYNSSQLFAEKNGDRYYLYFFNNSTKTYINRNNGTNTTNINNAAYSTRPDDVIYTFAPGSTLRQGSTRIFELKKAVAGFVETVNQMDTKEDGTRIGNKLSIITYYRYMTMYQDLKAVGDIDMDVLLDKVWGFTLDQGTAPHLGINEANTQFADNPHTGETIGEDFTRTVVLFTDGEPYPTTYAAVGSAQTSKQTYGATVYSIGMFSTSPTQGSTTWNFLNYISSNYPNAYLNGDGSSAGHMQPGTDGNANAGFYIDASSTAVDLSAIFKSIAEASGGSSFDLGSSTVVQDVISPSFQLNIPQGVSAGAVIRAYAPKCNGKDGDAFTFEDTITGATRMTLNTNGIVVGNDENRLANNIVVYNAGTKTLTFSGFNFNEMYVAQELDDEGHPVLDDDDKPIFFGRKLQIFIPLEISNGAWGDGISTNGPMSVIYPNNDIQNPIYFNNPTAHVLGSVWTEVVVARPPGFPIITGTGEGQTVDIDSPEDLAWFISEVNGRIGYNVKDGYNSNNVASHPKLNGRLTADIDMSAHNWVPIGCGWQVEVDPNTGLTIYKYVDEAKVHMTYEGTFDGNGHVITGLKNNASKYYKQINQNVGGVLVFPGMFSDVSGTVKNVFVLEADFHGKYHTENFKHHGIIADTLSEGGFIFNCEAAGRIICNNDDPTNDVKLIYGGLVGLNEGTIHSCMAMAELTGYTMGGMIGDNKGSFSNGFTNGVYNYLDNGVTGKFAGGIAGVNSGTINNCYVRFERPNTNLDKMGTGFGMIYGSNTGTNNVTNCYTPQIVTYSRPDYLSGTEAININTSVPTNAQDPSYYNENEPYSYTLTVTPTFYNMFTNDNSTGGTWGTETNSQGTYNVYSGGTPLLNVLNNGRGNGASWKRTTAGAYSEGAGDINDDYPVLKFAAFGNDAVTCLGSADGIRIDYATSLNDMLHRHNNGNFNENTALVGDKYKPTNHAAIYKGAINLFANDDVTIETTGTGSKDGEEEVADDCTAEGVVIYIDENISLLQGEDSEIEAYTGQTLQAFNNTGIQAGDRWHNISSSLSNSMFGWYYTNLNEVAHSWSDNPCGWTSYFYDEDEAFFPIDLNSRHRADFYCFFEPEYHWVNFKRNGVSHWHMDDYTTKIQYEYTLNGVTHELENEEQFIPGKGYLAAIDMSTYWEAYGRQAQFMQNRGTLNNGDVNINVTYTPTATYDLAGYQTGLEGYNLLGNPYQSFLDFDVFYDQNSSVLSNSKYANTYAVYDPEQEKYVQYMPQSSTGSKAAGRCINMHQGFFIQVNTSGLVTFKNTMRTNDAMPNFRGEKPAFPLINFTVTDSIGNTDLAILEVNRDENDGAKKLRMGNSAGRIFFRYDNEKLAIFFRDNAEGSQSLHFAAEENGNFTLSWDRANDNFSSLTLVDNITGVKTDMLTHDSYTFEGNTNDYSSRFKIVFGNANGEDEDEDTIGSENFAFFNEGNLIVNGEGQLDVVDVLGRVLYSTELTDTQNTVSLPHNAKGVCVLRITNGDNVKVQKIVVR